MLYRVDMLFYLDAGTGSMLVQLAVAGAAGAAVAGKVGWAKITGPFRRKQSAEVTGPDSERGDHFPHSTADD